MAMRNRRKLTEKLAGWVTGPLILAAGSGLVYLWLFGDSRWPSFANGIHGAQAAYWGFFLIMFAHWAGRHIYSLYFEKAQGTLARIIYLGCAGAIVYFIGTQRPGDDLAKWNETLRLGLILLPPFFIGTLQKPWKDYAEEIKRAERRGW